MKGLMRLGSENFSASTRSLESHWSGLMIFLEYPEVLMDNNQAERELRGLVVGRKNLYGSGAVWSGELAEKLYSIFRTLNIWRVNPQAWLNMYLDACAHAGGAAPEAPERFLPWNLTSELRHKLAIGSSEPLAEIASRKPEKFSL